jgi:hypothetical protein
MAYPYFCTCSEIRFMDCLTQICTSWSKLTRDSQKKARALQQDDAANPRPGKRTKSGSKRREPPRLQPSAPLRTCATCVLGDRPTRDTPQPVDPPSDEPGFNTEPNPGHDITWFLEVGTLHVNAWDIELYEEDTALCDNA